MSSYQSASFITYWLCIIDCELKTKNFQKRVLLTISPTLNTINKQLILLIFQGGALLKNRTVAIFSATPTSLHLGRQNEKQSQ